MDTISPYHATSRLVLCLERLAECLQQAGAAEDPRLRPEVIRRLSEASVNLASTLACITPQVWDTILSDTLYRLLLTRLTHS